MSFDSRNISASEWLCSTGTSAAGANSTILLRFGAQDVRCGDEVALSTSASMPTISIPGTALTGTNYTIIVVDRDATSAVAPTRSPLRHMTLEGVPRAALERGVARADDALAPVFPYSGPRPPAGTGCHRYYAMIYQQTDGVPVQPFNVSNRYTWDFPTWAGESSLTKVGVTFWRTGNAFPCDGSSPAAAGGAASTFSNGALAACIVIPLLLFAAFLGWRWREGRRAGGAPPPASDASSAPYTVVENPAWQ
jgi:hypothetical protein